MRGIDIKNGKHRVRYSDKGKPRSRSFVSLDKAIEFRDAVYREVALADVRPVSGMSLRQAGPGFLLRRKSLRNYPTDRSRWNTHVATAHFADKALDKVTRRDVLDWVEGLETTETAGRGEVRLLARQSRKHALNLLRKFFDYCVDRDVMPANVALRIKVSGEPSPIPDDWYLTPVEQALLATFPGEEKNIALFAMGTGLRQGEQWSLRLVDAHPEGPTPHVLVKFGSEGRTPKSKKARVVPLFGVGLQALREWLAHLPAYLEGKKKSNPFGLVFPTMRGARRGRSKVPREWSRMVAHLGRHVHWHLLRHTAASSLVAGWWGKRWALEEVKSFMGHSSITVTERYAHLADSRLHELAAATGQQPETGTTKHP